MNHSGAATELGESQPLISIVLPTYNGARYLSESVMSVIRQNYQNWELIIVDDGSTDQTPEIISRLCALDRRIRTIRHARTSRLPHALNTGFREASGELLSWTSDDNLYRPEALARMESTLAERQDVQIVFTDCSAIDSTGRHIRRLTWGPAAELPFSNSIGACFLYRKCVREDIGDYRDDMFLVEDYDFWLRAARKMNFLHLPEDLYLYRFHDKSLSSSRERDVRRAAVLTLSRNLPLLTRVDPATRRRAYFALTKSARQIGFTSMARTSLIKAVASDPTGSLVALCRLILKRLRGPRP